MVMEAKLTHYHIMAILFTKLPMDLNRLTTLGKKVNNLNINESEKMELRKVYKKY